MLAVLCFFRDNSIGPCFVAILGDKYGYRPIPPKLSMTKYLQILNHLEKEETKESLEAVSLMKEWYQEDTNSLGGKLKLPGRDASWMGDYMLHVVHSCHLAHAARCAHAPRLLLCNDQ